MGRNNQMLSVLAEYTMKVFEFLLSTFFATKQLNIMLCLHSHNCIGDARTHVPHHNKNDWTLLLRHRNEWRKHRHNEHLLKIRIINTSAGVNILAYLHKIETGKDVALQN